MPVLFVFMFNKQAGFAAKPVLKINRVKSKVQQTMKLLHFVGASFMKP
jgi:hypothetical protein